MTRANALVPVVLALAAALAGCSNRTRLEPVEGGIGARCATNNECREDLVCRTNATCGPAGGTVEGDPCTYTDNCEDGLACLWERDSAGVAHTYCRAAGTSADGEFCASTAQCESGLVCVPEGFGGRCRQGAEIGAPGDEGATFPDGPPGLAFRGAGARCR